MISILIPLRNEYENLDGIERIFKDNFHQIKHEVILVNDYSTDNTLNKAKEIAEKNKNFVVLNNLKEGLGGAINLGIEKSNGKFVCIMMADLSDDINDLKKYYNLIYKVFFKLNNILLFLFYTIFLQNIFRPRKFILQTFKN